jgi:hypothetical protein
MPFPKWFEGAKLRTYLLKERNYVIGAMILFVFSSVILTFFVNPLENFANIFYIMKFKGKNKLDGIGEK